MYAAYTIAGRKTITTEAEAVNGFLKGYREFVRLFRKVVNTWVSPQYRFLFAPARVGQARLECYGIQNHVLCIRSERISLGQIAEQLHQVLAGLTSKHSKTNAGKLACGNLNAKPKKIVWRGGPME